MNMTLSNNHHRGIHPVKFGLWIAMGSITMMFIALTSAYIVRQSAGNWLEFRLPSVFLISTLVLLLSSAFLHLSYKAFLKMEAQKYRGFLLAALVAGIGFVVMQYEGWLALNEIGIRLQGNPSGSFVYAISGIHVAHVIGGIAALVVAVIHAFGLPVKPTERRKVRLQLTMQYWHFVDILWVYLLIFFLITR